ncbi:MAG: hypothetical protein ACYTGH_14135 [Planctomycetota bacterium]|jgi:hypothetical protein
MQTDDILELAKRRGVIGAADLSEIGVNLRVYSPAKTVVDCFKFRNRVGLDIAREALVDALAQKKATSN